MSDLFAGSPSYPAVMPNDLNEPGRMIGRPGPSLSGGFGGGGLGGGGLGGSGGAFRVPPAPPGAPRPVTQYAGSLSMRATQVSIDQLVNTIKATVEPDRWGTNRDNAKIEKLGNTLLITASDDMHHQINNLLNLFREHWGKRRTISIQTYWVQADATDTADLLDQKSNDEVGAGVVSADRWKAFVEKAKTEKRFVYSATLTGHNNQTLHAVSGRQRQLTLDAETFETTTATGLVREHG